MMSTVEINHLKKKFGRKKIFDDFNLALEKGSVTGLFGPNGSGKTTLLKILAGLIVAYKGEVYIQGEKPGAVTKSFVSYLPDSNYLQNQHQIKNTLNLFERFYDDFNREKAYSLLKEMGLDEKMKIAALSKGMQEKLHLALCLSRQAKLYLIDEPLAGVDPVAREQIIKAVIGNMEAESTMLITTHLISDMETIFDRILFLRDGKIILDEDSENLRFQRGASIDEIYRMEFGGVDDE